MSVYKMLERDKSIYNVIQCGGDPGLETGHVDISKFI